MDVHVTGRRVLATIADSVILGIVYSLYSLVFDTPYETDTTGFDFAQLSSRGGFAFLAIVVAYYTLMEGVLGQTLGKMVMGIQVVDASTGRPPGLVSGLVRTVARLIDGAFAYVVALLVAANSERRRRIGDMLAKTLVVKKS